jgi:hypothetical protein
MWTGGTPVVPWWKIRAPLLRPASTFRKSSYEDSQEMGEKSGFTDEKTVYSSKKEPGRFIFPVRISARN